MRICRGARICRLAIGRPAGNGSLPHNHIFLTCRRCQARLQRAERGAGSVERGASEQQSNPKSEIRNPIRLRCASTRQEENRNPKLEVRSSFCAFCLPRRSIRAKAGAFWRLISFPSFAVKNLLRSLRLLRVKSPYPWPSCPIRGEKIPGSCSAYSGILR